MVKIVNNQKVLEKVDIAQSSSKEEMADTLPEYMENGATQNGGYGPTEDRPTTVEPGTVYYDTTLGYQIIWNGTSWEQNGGLGNKIKEVTEATASIVQNDSFISVLYSTTGTVTLSLPAATDFFDTTTNTGFSIEIADTGGGAGTYSITINSDGTDTIITDVAGQSSTAIDGNGDVIKLIAINATTWKVY